MDGRAIRADEPGRRALLLIVMGAAQIVAVAAVMGVAGRDRQGRVGQVQDIGRALQLALGDRRAGGGTRRRRLVIPEQRPRSGQMAAEPAARGVWIDRRIIRRDRHEHRHGHGCCRPEASQQIAPLLQRALGQRQIGGRVVLGMERVPAAPPAHQLADAAQAEAAGRCRQIGRQEDQAGQLRLLGRLTVQDVVQRQAGAQAEAGDHQLIGGIGEALDAGPGRRPPALEIDRGQIARHRAMARQQDRPDQVAGAREAAAEVAHLIGRSAQAMHQEHALGELAALGGAAFAALGHQLERAALAQRHRVEALIDLLVGLGDDRLGRRDIAREVLAGQRQGQAGGLKVGGRRFRRGTAAKEQQHAQTEQPASGQIRHRPRLAQTCWQYYP